MKRSRSIVKASLAAASAVALALALAFGIFAGHAGAAPVQGTEVLHGTHLMGVMGVRGALAPKASTANDLTYHGGVSGSGVVTGSDKVYLVYWGSQWNSNDPSGEATLQQSFFNHVGGSSWNNSVTQYCQGVAVGTVTCGSSGTHATNPLNVLGGVWFDNASAAPSHPTQSQLGSEAVRAASHFGNTTASANTHVQYVINTATHNSSSGFGTQYCAYHSSATASFGGRVAFTNMPYITDAGSSCGANFNGLGSKAGITIVGGHEFAETETDIYPNGGWLDSGGAENGDKCAWIASGQGAIQRVTMNGTSFPVQSLWSNAFNSGAGGCVQSF